MELLQRHGPPRHLHRHHASMSAAPSSSRYRSFPERKLPSTPRPVTQHQLREEDECPICHGALPPSSADGSEVAREAHVSECIETHFSSSTPRASHLPHSASTEAAFAAIAATPSQAAGTGNIPTGHRVSLGSQDLTSPSFQQRRRASGMVVYHATEKDCVGEDGKGEAECVICFEEFAVGDEMGRLECLCKFHKVCIVYFCPGGNCGIEG